jgi:hypothetical protein
MNSLKQNFIREVIQDFDISPIYHGNHENQVPTNYEEYKKFWFNIMKLETITVLKEACKSKKYIMVSSIITSFSSIHTFYTYCDRNTIKFSCQKTGSNQIK